MAVFSGKLTRSTSSPIFVGDIVKSHNSGYFGKVIQLEDGTIKVRLLNAWGIPSCDLDDNWDFVPEKEWSQWMS